jgi:hypothetical protein
MLMLVTSGPIFMMRFDAMINMKRLLRNGSRTRHVI